ncbi:MAG: cell envelope integrity protein TolA, partial [Gammaproteobacteria bacterium]|nr:cell envelope integrity protein TolA [Gammaproteobacteria bacterium]
EQDASEQRRVVAAITAKIERGWLRPPGTEGLKCTVRVRLGGTGSVLLVNVVESSGNIAFDRSVEAAVRKADPLPMPESDRLRAVFRDLTFIFDPSN